MINRIKELLKLSPIPLSKNHLYDKLTKRIIKQVLNKNSNCIDVGCHKGEILDLLYASAPEGKHLGFEPIPQMADALKEKYINNHHCEIHQLALSNESGTTSFNYVISNPSYSGLIKRKYDRKNEEDTLIIVKTEMLDNILPRDYPVELIKIDVEGGEMLVLEGASKTIKRSKPHVIFEHGLGASEFYKTSPDQIYTFFEEHELKISNLKSFLNKETPLSKEAFEKEFYQKRNYYFIAHP